MNLRKYHTQMICLEDRLFRPPPYIGRGWRITLEPYPFSNQFTHYEPHPEMPRRRETAEGKELVIYAPSLVEAQRVALLLYATLCLLEGEVPLRWFRDMEPPILIPDDQAEIDEQDILETRLINQVKGHAWQSRGFSIAAQAAAKISHRRAWQYALFRYYLSLQLIGVDNSALHPSIGNTSFRLSKSIVDHVYYSHSLLSAWLVVEDLELGVKASAKKPSFIDGEWNPEVKNDLENRLIRANINLFEDFVWHVRGGRSRLTEKKRPIATGDTEWSYGYIQDKYVKVIDAINHANWLRSNIAAHKFGPYTSSLNVVDVANVQHLARRLLMEATGFWRVWREI